MGNKVSSVSHLSREIIKIRYSRGSIKTFNASKVSNYLYNSDFETLEIFDKKGVSIEIIQTINKESIEKFEIILDPICRGKLPTDESINANLNHPVKKKDLIKSIQNNDPIKSIKNNDLIKSIKNDNLIKSIKNDTLKSVKKNHSFKITKNRDKGFNPKNKKQIGFH